MSPSRTIRVYYDGENVAYADYAQKTKGLKTVLDAIQWAVRTKLLPDTDRINVLQYWYGDATSNEMQRHKDAVLERGLSTRLIYTIKSKNSCDLAMTVDMMKDAYGSGGLMGERTDIYVIVTSDADFRHVAQALREKGRRIIGIGYRSCSTAAVTGAYEKGCFLNIEDIVEEYEMTPEMQKRRIETENETVKEAEQKEYEAQKRAFEMLKKENEAQKRNYDALRKEKDTLKTINESLKKERTELLASDKTDKSKNNSLPISSKRNK